MNLDGYPGVSRVRGSNRFSTNDPLLLRIFFENELRIAGLVKSTKRLQLHPNWTLLRKFLHSKIIYLYLWLHWIKIRIQKLNKMWVDVFLYRLQKALTHIMYIIVVFLVDRLDKKKIIAYYYSECRLRTGSTPPPIWWCPPCKYYSFSLLSLLNPNPFGWNTP